ncbi:hypothetical protein CEUSTIGMA_g2863.t1 [Chlamydomonas eustigma]|uniref:Uncharacterized protein n=1 Tax=Chlamydomonas eustigma TaxID=1157962 RepID=A0A250WXJ3_9CHLO|nr:hypothetical protein CEUSTIGMA_g2863.t1 [Chlamydomonas eustigma]|eukprot:GAX75419.1 hypothetical protein CEUSTIGMA_g2863.t1 [Chlamydomonas eustigma]
MQTKSFTTSLNEKRSDLSRASRLLSYSSVIFVQNRKLVSRKFSSSLVAAPVKVEEQLKEQEALLPLPRVVEGLVDDPSIHNPLERSHRLGTGWFGVICEYEGVLVESHWEGHMQAWLRVASELGYPRPLGQSFRRVRGLRDDVVVSRVFNWTQNPMMAKKIAERKSEVYEEMCGGRQPAEMLEAKPFLDMLRRYKIPVATSCALPEKSVLGGLQRHGLSPYFNTVVTAADGGATEVEWYFMYAAQQIQRPPMRCIVIGNNPVYNFTSADLVVKDLSQLSFLNLKKLFGEEQLVEPRLSPEESEQVPARYEAFSDGFEDDSMELDQSTGGGLAGQGLAFYR